MWAEQSSKGPGSRGRPGGCSAHYSPCVNRSHGEVETRRVQTRLSWNCSPLGKTTRVPQRHESAAPAEPKTAKWMSQRSSCGAQMTPSSISTCMKFHVGSYGRTDTRRPEAWLTYRRDQNTSGTLAGSKVDHTVWILRDGAWWRACWVWGVCYWFHVELR